MSGQDDTALTRFQVEVARLLFSCLGPSRSSWPGVPHCSHSS